MTICIGTINPRQLVTKVFTYSSCLIYLCQCPISHTMHITQQDLSWLCHIFSAIVSAWSMDKKRSIFSFWLFLYHNVRFAHAFRYIVLVSLISVRWNWWSEISLNWRHKSSGGCASVTQIVQKGTASFLWVQFANDFLPKDFSLLQIWFLQWFPNGFYLHWKSPLLPGVSSIV